MKAIFLQNCGLWWMNTCSNEDLKKLRKNMILKGDKFECPNEDELKRLNKICSRCRQALQVYEEKCPVCGAHNISKSVFDINSTVFLDVYFYKCSTCKRNLYSTKRFY